MGFQPYIENRQDSNGSTKTYLVAEAIAISGPEASDTAATGGQLLVGDGTAAVPALSFQADNDTGFFRVVANTINVAIGGVNYHNLSANGIVSGTALVSSGPSSGVGYTTGAGGSIVQSSSRATGVTLSKVCGVIQTDTTSLAAGAVATFTVTNTVVAAGDNVIVTVQSGLTTTQTDVKVTAVAAGSFNISVANRHSATAEVGAIAINFAVIKSVTA